MKTPELKLVTATQDVFEALNLVQEGKVDLAFLDIQMPELTGIQFLKICSNKCRFILTTAYPEYAIDGFELDVIDYLLKPVSYERFYKAVLKVQQAFHQTGNSGLNNDFIFIKGDAKNKFIKINYNDILYIEGLKNYVSIYTTTQKIVTYQTLRELEVQLPNPPFYRIHKSYIIAIDKISIIESNAVMINNRYLPVGETYREAFLKVIKEYKLE